MANFMDASPQPVPVRGIFDISQKSSSGRLIDPKFGGRCTENDVQVPQSLVQKLRLKVGQEILGNAVEDGRNRRLIFVETIDGMAIGARRNCMPFLRATTTLPTKPLKTETTEDLLTTRVIDLFSPIGRGTRGLIVAPPKTGKTTLLQHIARGILTNHPDVHLMILLVDERPEEVTDFRKNIAAEIFASSNDEPIQRHLHIAQLAFQRAQNLVESGRDVVLLLDSVTRLARAFNNAMGRSGRTMTGGLDAQALEKPRQLFALARATEEIGSLTTIATALVETGSRMDELIFQEFKGTGNLEIVLDRRAAEQRLFPAINLQSTGTRREELLLDEKSLEASQLLRRALANQKPEIAIETLLSRMAKSKNNGEFIELVTRR